MKKFLVCAAVLWATPLLAQQPQEKLYTLKVTEAQINLISKGLQTQPFGEVFPLMQMLQSQIIEQNKPVEKPAEDPK